METVRVNILFLCCVVGLLSMGVFGSGNMTGGSGNMTGDMGSGGQDNSGGQVEMGSEGQDESYWSGDEDEVVQATPCKGTRNCLMAVKSKECKESITLANCLNKAKKECSVDETKVTFLKVQHLYTEFCKVVDRFPKANMECQSVLTCRNRAQDNAGTPDPKDFFKGIATPNGMCTSLVDQSKCLVEEKTKCKFSGDFVNAIKEITPIVTKGCSGEDKTIGTKTSRKSGATKTAGNTPLWLAASLAAVLTSLV